jgi:tRNA(Ile)-lysidine synthase
MSTSTENSQSPPVPSTTSDYVAFPDSILVSHAGIKLYRPLLEFPKSRLIATCEANSVPFVTDSSNFDPKTTERNAIRWLISNDKMPMALRQDSVLRIGAASARCEEARSKKLIQLMNATHVTNFDIRSSRLTVVPPREIGNLYNASDADAAFYVDRLLSLVSPGGKVTESFMQLKSIARWMFLELRDQRPSKLDIPANLRTCTARDVLIQRRSVGPVFAFEMTRRPFRADQDPHITFSTAPFYAKGKDRDWSKWTVWDGRYWIRIRVSDANDLKNFKVRALRQSDMEELNGRRDKHFEKIRLKLENTLRQAAPGKVRYTLPVFVEGEELRALPTFDIEFPSHNDVENGVRVRKAKDGLQWEVRYKDITEILQYL